MNIVKKLMMSIAMMILVATTVYAQRFAVTSGNWTDAIWASTQGGVAGSAEIPTSADNVTVNSGIIVTVNTAEASCLSVNFQDFSASFALASGSILNVYGDLTIDSTGKAFSSWATGAKLRFTGSNQQFIRGFRVGSNSLDSTVLMEVVVDKSGDTLKTPGIDMKIGLGTSLEIKRGVMVLGSRDDINGRTFALASATPTITVDSGAGFTMAGSLSAIRSGVSGTGRIGKMTINGTVHFATTSTIGICLGGVEIQSGASLYMDSFSSSALNNVHLDSVYVRRGATLYNSSTTNFWDNTASLVVTLDTGAVYKVTTSTTNFPLNFNNTGTVRYQRTAGDSSQTIVDMNYYRLEVSFGGNKVWTLGADRYIYDSLEINNKANFSIVASSPHNLTVINTLRLTSGNINNSDANVTLTLSDGANISRATGTISAAPYFDGGVNLRYTSTTTSVPTGPEVPSSSSVLQDLSIICDTQTVTLASPMTVNGTMTLSNGTLNNDSQSLTMANNSYIRRATGVVSSPIVWAGIANVAYISSISSVVTGNELPSATNVLQNLQIICDTLTVTLSAPVTVNGLLTLSNGIFNNTGATLTLANGASIRRATAELTAAPEFAGTVNLAYISVLSSVLTGFEIPSSSNVLQTLSIESPMNVTLTTSVAVNESLAFSRGVLYLGNNDVTLASGAVVGGTPSDSTMLITNGSGMLKKEITTPESNVFPVGDTLNGVMHYTPITLHFTSGTFEGGAFAGVRVAGTKHPNNLAQTDYLNRYWVTTSTGISNFTCNVYAQYLDNDIAGDESKINLSRWDGGNWSWLTPANSGSNLLEASNITALGDLTGAPSAGTYSMIASWNLVSVPFNSSNLTKSNLFPTAISNAFQYNNGYVTKDTLVPGYGYWLKFPSAQSIPMLGFPVTVETVAVTQGWNLIGSISTPLYVGNVTGIGTSPASNYFYYDGGYKTTDTLKPGLGFWIKVSSSGQLVLSSSTFESRTSSEKFNKNGISTKEYAGISFTDALGNTQTLYAGTGLNDKHNLEMFEMPPLPKFAEAFDVRFASNRYVEVVNKGKQVELPVLVTASHYPVTMQFENNTTVSNTVISIKIGNTTNVLSGKSSIVIKDASEKVTVVLQSREEDVPAVYSLQQNYPNPFNPTTMIQYSLAEESKVTLDVFTLLGQKVQSLVVGQQASGMHSINWNAEQMPSGLYFYKLSATGLSGAQFSQVRKMTLLK